MRVLKHNPYVKIKQFFNEGIKQNNVSTIIWSIKFLPIQWSRSTALVGSCLVYMFVYITKLVYSLTSNHIFVHFNHYDYLFFLIIKDVHKVYRVYGWKTETESTNWGQVYLYHELMGEAAF